ncbi:MAG: TetR/AcrR family transcriptional regulator [Thermoanaerobaculia bacterium]
MVQTTSTRPRRTHSKALAKKRQILEAASRVFRRKGLHATGMRDIAAELGMQVGNLYYYFENRQELLAFCQRDALSGLLQLAAWVAETELPASGKLYLLIKGHVVHVNEGTQGSLAHLEVEALESRWRRKIQARRDEYEAAVRRLVADGVADGTFRAVDAKTAALAILGAMNWTVKWFRPAGTKNARQIGDEFAEQLVRGLLAPGVELDRPEMELPDLATPEPTDFS